MVGLTPAEEELYRCLVQLTTTHIDELTERLHRSRTDIITHLDALRAKGLVLPADPEPDAALRPLRAGRPARQGTAAPAGGPQVLGVCDAPHRTVTSRGTPHRRHVARWTPGGPPAGRQVSVRLPPGPHEAGPVSDGSPASPAPAGRTWPPADR
ncbi:hypothetical protein [Micromonospora gifhornensis]|uniref:hypothetical protein n=1 Tax=Micromonospora gifhornensis TaxID=84594 RepID=UPI003F4F7143